MYIDIYLEPEPWLERLMIQKAYDEIMNIKKDNGKMATVFADICNRYALISDRLMDAQDWDKLGTFVQELETYVETHGTKEYAPIYYYIGTIYGELANHARDRNQEDMVPAEMDDRKRANYYSRKAMELLDDDEPLLLFVYTNYANNLDSCGRVIEALRMYRKAVERNPKFAMAVGNYGRALDFLADIVNDEGHYRELHCYAYQAMDTALKMNDPNMHEAAIACFSQMVEQYPEQTQIPREYLQREICYPAKSWNSDEESHYRIWCLTHNLFLNPLNEVLDSPRAFAHDPLTIIRYTEPVAPVGDSLTARGEPPKYFAMLNQLKEEYIYARFLCYEGLHKYGDVHFADKDVRLSNGLDYANYSIRLEQLKSAYRILFSLFDQLAFFVNAFWNMGYEEHRASADTIFRSERFPNGNCALTAMRWTYTEFYERFGNAEKASERELKDLRNALEHKFVKIHEYSWDRTLKLEPDGFYHTDEKQFMNYTLRLLQLTRENIMYLVYAVGIHERRHRKDGAKSVCFSIQDFDDDWKR